MLSDELTPFRILRRPEVLTLVGVSSATLARWVLSGHFPRPLRIGPNSTGWRFTAVREWIESREPVGTTTAAEQKDQALAGENGARSPKGIS